MTGKDRGRHPPNFCLRCTVHIANARSSMRMHGKAELPGCGSRMECNGMQRTDPPLQLILAPLYH